MMQDRTPLKEAGVDFQRINPCRERWADQLVTACQEMVSIRREAMSLWDDVHEHDLAPGEKIDRLKELTQALEDRINRIGELVGE